MKNIILLMAAGILLLGACNEEKDIADAYGNFEAKGVSVSVDVSGRLMEYTPEEGDILKEGELVAIVDTVPFKLALGELQAQRDAVYTKTKNIDAQKLTLEEEMKTVKKEEKRLEQLYSDGAVTGQKVDEMDGRKRVLQSRIDALKVQRRTVYSEIAVVDSKILQMQDKLSRCYLNNPLPGTVLETYCEQHEMVMAGIPLYRLADLENMELKVYVDAILMGKIKIGDKAKVFVDDEVKTKREMEGRISWISSSAEFTPKIIQTKEERVKLVYAVKVLVKNDGSLKIGMPGEVMF